MLSSKSFHFEDSGLDLFIPPDSLPDDVNEVEVGCSVNAFPSFLYEHCEADAKLIRNSVSFEGLQSIRFKNHVHLRLQHCADSVDEIHVAQSDHRQAMTFKRLQRQFSHPINSNENYFIVEDKYIHIYTKKLTCFSCYVVDVSCLLVPQEFTLVVYASLQNNIQTKVFIYDDQYHMEKKVW